MVYSRVYSQYSAHCLLPVAHEHRSSAASNADMRLLEAETGERDCKGNSPCGVNLRTSKEHARSGYGSMSSSIKSSWIQRLIPAHVTMVEQQQFTNNPPVGREDLDGLQADYDAVFKSDSGKQSGFGLYENSGRSSQFLSSRNELLLTKSATHNEQVDVSAPVTSRICDLDLSQPKIQVPPRTLPVVESLLNPGSSKHVLEAQMSLETNRLNNLSKSSGFSNPIKQTVHFFGNNRCRVSCSSIEGLNSPRSRCGTGDSTASLLGDKHLNGSQPTLEYSFNHPGLMQANSSATRTLEDLHVGQECIQTTRNRSELSQEHQDYGKGTVFASEVSSSKGGALAGGVCSNSGLGKDGSPRMSDLDSSQFNANTREKTSLSLAPCVVEQELGSSGDFHKEQDVTSGSFSFHSKGRLPYVSADAKVATERGHWPFYEVSPYIEPSVLPKDLRTRDSVEAPRLGMPLNNMSSMQPDYAYARKPQNSPFFGMETLTKWESNTEALYKYGVASVAGTKLEEGRQLNGCVMSSRLRTNALMKSAKERDKYTHSSEAINRTNWEGFKHSFKSSTLSVGSIESCSKRPADAGTEDRASAPEARNVLTVIEGAIAHPGGGLRSRDVGPGLRKSMWLNRWSTISQEQHFSLKLQANREEGIVNSRHFVEYDHSSSQSSWESSHHFDIRPAKRACYGQRFGLHSEPSQAIHVLGSIGFGSQDQQEMGVTSHFMKRFLTPSGAAMAVMGMMARKTYAKQPQKGGVFGARSVISSENKPRKGQAEVGKEFMKRQENKKEFMHSSGKPFETQVDA